MSESYCRQLLADYCQLYEELLALQQPGHERHSVCGNPQRSYSQHSPLTEEKSFSHTINKFCPTLRPWRPLDLHAERPKVTRLQVTPFCEHRSNDRLLDPPSLVTIPNQLPSRHPIPSAQRLTLHPYSPRLIPLPPLNIFDYCNIIDE